MFNANQSVDNNPKKNIYTQLISLNNANNNSGGTITTANNNNDLSLFSNNYNNGVNSQFSFSSHGASSSSSSAVDTTKVTHSTGQRSRHQFSSPNATANQNNTESSIYGMENTRASQYFTKDFGTTASQPSFNSTLQKFDIKNINQPAPAFNSSVHNFGLQKFSQSDSGVVVFRDSTLNISDSNAVAYVSNNGGILNSNNSQGSSTAKYGAFGDSTSSESSNFIHSPLGTTYKESTMVNDTDFANNVRLEGQINEVLNSKLHQRQELEKLSEELSLTKGGALKETVELSGAAIRLYAQLVEHTESQERKLKDTNARLEAIMTAMAIAPPNGITKYGKYDVQEVAHRFLIKQETLKQENTEFKKLLDYGKAKEHDIIIGLLVNEMKTLSRQKERLEKEIATTN
ncbi:Mum2 protein [Saccharomycopsis crataegensis]|uniref:Mum2 protein n=1 Tax=Saccharomycopsis crataegensis TaxID=43959 RepID=A0AAV5QFD2_9ASCO|nr:Mum2 protein [Saccharomycopsis crataegensis]